MGNRSRSALSRWIIVFSGLLIAACSTLPVGEYSLEAYKNATSLKAETLALVAKSTGSYSGHVEDVEALNVKIDAAYEFAAGTPNNQISAEQWRLLRDPDGDLYGLFLNYWRQRGHLAPALSDQLGAQIGEAYDYIICLEANKQAQTSCRQPV
jgi:hypothetical protein